MSVIPSQFHLIGKLLDASSVRAQVTGQNIANVNTPGYKAHEVRFEDRLEAALEDPQGQFETLEVTPEVVLQTGLTERADGNNVDLDTELGKSQKNALLYSAYTRILSSKISAMRSAISGR